MSKTNSSSDTASRRRPRSGASSVFSPRDVLFVLFRHRLLVPLTFLAIAGMAATVALLLPAKYESNAEMLVKVGRESLNVDAAAELSGSRQQLMLDREREINSEVAMLENRQNAEAVVAALGSDRILAAADQRKADVDPEDERLEAVERVLSNIGISSKPKSNVLQVSYTAGDAELARDVVQNYVESFLIARSVAHGGGDPAVYEQTLAEAERELDSINAKLQELKNETGISDFELQRDNLVNRINDFDNGITNTEQLLASAMAEQNSVKSRLATLPERVLERETTGAANSAVETLRTTISELRMEEQELATRYRDDAPALRSIRAQIDSAKESLDDALSNSEQTLVSNPVVMELRKKDEELASSIASNGALLVKLQRDLEAARTKLKDLNAVESRYVTLMREQRIASDKVEQTAVATAQVKLSQSFTAENVSNISISQAATFNPKPVGPNRPLLLIVGLALATVAAGAAAFAAEGLDHTIKRPEDLSRIGVRQGSVVSVPNLQSGAAVARGPAEFFDEVKHSLGTLFGTAGQRSSSAARSGARGFFGTIGYIFSGVVRGIIWIIGSVLLLIGNLVVTIVTLPWKLLTSIPLVPFLRDVFGGKPKRNTHDPVPAAGDEWVHMQQWKQARQDKKRGKTRRKQQVVMEKLVDELIVADYDELQDIDPAEMATAEPKAAPDRKFFHTARLVSYAAKRDAANWWQRDARPNLQLTDTDHRTVAGEAVWRASRGLLEQLLIESDTDAATDIPDTIAVIGARPGSGTSTIASHLSAVLAERVAEEAHDRGDQNGQMHDDRKPVLILRVLDETRRRDGSDELSPEPTPVPGLDRAEVLTVRTAGVRRAIEQGKQRYKHVVVDLLPVYSDLGSGRMKLAGEAREEAGPRLAALCDTSVLIVEAEKLRREAANRAMERLDRAGADVAVVVLNKREYPVPQFIYKRA